jgi:peptidoglycan/xylan/chitin deacetylase (PgdA/CDA1 family)
MGTRRQFLVGGGAGALGLAVGATAGHLVTAAEDQERAEVSRAAERRFLEAGGAASEGQAVARLGTHRIVWSLPVSEPVVALSFDDGPTPEFTPRVLDALAAVGATATFNVMGYNAVRHADLIQQIDSAGHEIGNHTWTHLDLSKLTTSETREQIVRCAQELEGITGRPVTSFRPPRGELTGYALRVCAELGYEVHMWSCTRGPGNETSPQAVGEYIGQTPVAGDVLGLHDGIGRGTVDPQTAFARRLADRREVEVRALPTALARLVDRGLQLVSIGQMMALGQ